MALVYDQLEQAFHGGKEAITKFFYNCRQNEQKTEVALYFLVNMEELELQVSGFQYYSPQNLHYRTTKLMVELHTSIN